MILLFERSSHCRLDVSLLLLLCIDTSWCNICEWIILSSDGVLRSGTNWHPELVEILTGDVSLSDLLSALELLLVMLVQRLTFLAIDEEEESEVQIEDNDAYEDQNLDHHVGTCSQAETFMVVIGDGTDEN